MSEILMVGKILANDLKEEDRDRVEFTGSYVADTAFPYWLSIRTPKGTVLVFEFSKEERDKLFAAWA